MTARTLLIYAKPPRMGLAKTRLARGLGHSAAQRIARMGFSRTLRAAIDPRWQTVLYTAPDLAVHETLGGLWPPALIRRAQGRGDLGDRLARGLDEAPHGRVVFIGADAPDISRALIWQAFRALTQHDAVFGPASDGGFWLFGLHAGLRRQAPFEKVRWSGPNALADVRANLPEGARIAMLAELIDIDEAVDWRAWRREKARP